jgi:isoquinoline 1-oxidoreductase alpha subunit
MARLNINGKVHDVKVEDDTPLLWVIREQIGLDREPSTAAAWRSAVPARCTSTASCKRSCMLPVGQASSQVTASSLFEGLVAQREPSSAESRGRKSTCRNAATASRARSWRPAALLAENPKPSDADIDAAMTNICRCGTYQRIRTAVHVAAAKKGELR